jgi:acetyltransferase-like isoleucine patch superfamily enzyme
MTELVYAGMPVPRVVRPFIRGLYRAGVWIVEGCTVARKLVWIEPVMRSVCFSIGRGLRADRLPYMRGKGRLTFGSHVCLSGRSSFYFMSGMPEEPEIAIGDHVFVGNGCTFSAARSITVGNHCLIAAGVRIHDNDGHPMDPERRRRGERIRADEAGPVVVEDNVWIGADATILKGLRIGRDAVIGAGAVVTADVAPGTVVAGNPARVVKTLVVG